MPDCRSNASDNTGAATPCSIASSIILNEVARPRRSAVQPAALGIRRQNSREGCEDTRRGGTATEDEHVTVGRIACDGRDRAIDEMDPRRGESRRAAWRILIPGRGRRRRSRHPRPVPATLPGSRAPCRRRARTLIHTTRGADNARASATAVGIAVRMFSSASAAARPPESKPNTLTPPRASRRATSSLPPARPTKPISMP